MKKLLIPLIAAGSLLYLPASHAEDPCKVIMCMAGKLTGDNQSMISQIISKYGKVRL